MFVHAFTVKDGVDRLDEEGKVIVYEVREVEDKDKLVVSFDERGCSRDAVYDKKDVDRLMDSGKWVKIVN